MALQNTGNFVTATATPAVLGSVLGVAGYGATFAFLAVPAALSSLMITKLLSTPSGSEGVRKPDAVPSTG
jgi:hypothetical protein